MVYLSINFFKYEYSEEYIVNYNLQVINMYSWLYFVDTIIFQR